jgi:Lactoylglutathione lyase and related lyases
MAGVTTFCANQSAAISSTRKIIRSLEGIHMEMKLELVAVPVTDIDRAKEFYVKVGFNADHDQRVNENLRFVQLTPPGSACSICIGQGLTQMKPGSIDLMIMVVKSAEAAREDLLSRGIEVSEIDEQPWGRFVYFSDPDGNKWSVQELLNRG